MSQLSIYHSAALMGRQSLSRFSLAAWLRLTVVPAFLLAVVASSPVSFPPGAPPGAGICTQEVCVPSITLNYPGIRTGRYWVDVTAGGQGIGAPCEVIETPVGVHTVRQLETRTPEGVVRPELLQIYCAGNGVLLGSWHPNTLLVRVGGDPPLTGFFEDIEYRETRPNGISCEPTCRRTALEIADLDADVDDTG